MALEDLTPVTRMESILDGDDISPVTRMEYFLGKAANEVPKPSGVSDAGKVLTVNAAGDGFELDTPDSGLPAYTGSDLGKVLTVGGTSESPAAGWAAASVGIFPVMMDGDSATLNKNYSEISAAMRSGLLPVVFLDYAYGMSSPIFGTTHDNGTYSVYAATPLSGNYVSLIVWSASSETGVLTAV